MAEEEKMTVPDVLAKLKKLRGWPIDAQPLSDAERNDRARVLEEQKRMLLAKEEK